MKINKKNPRKQLEKFSAVFMQLGLVLALFVVYVSLEYKTDNTQKAVVTKPIIPDNVYILDDHPVIIKKEVEVKQQTTPEPKKVIKPITDLSKINKTENNDTETSTIVKQKEIKPKILDANDIIEEDDSQGEIEPDTNLPFTRVENKPIFRGCEGLNETDGMKCFEKKMKKLITKYFDAELANELGLRSGKHRISTQFIIDKEGKVTDVKIRAPHPRLKKEVNKIVSKIPDFTPGKQNQKPVKVKYTLPITFRVE